MSLRYDAQGLLLNKLVADLQVLGKDVDNTEVIQLLTDECDKLRTTEGEGSAVYKKKVHYLDCLLKSRDDVQEMRTREQLTGVGSSVPPSKVVFSSLPISLER